MSVILITGTSSGIGLATAVHFARKGHDVYAAVRNPATATTLAETMAKEALPITCVTIDVDNADSVRRGVDEVLAKSGRVDVLVNNAGVGGGGPIEDVPVDWAKTLFEANYFGAIRMTQAVLPGMRVRASGAIVNISSVAGRYVPGGHGHYAAVKHALEAASEALALEVTPLGLRVVIIEPGMIVTPIFSKAKRFVAPESPYAHHVKRLLLFYQKQLPHAAPPTVVAETIEEAVTTPTPKLRWLVGDDAKRLVAGRSRISDEEFLADAQASTDDEWVALMRRRYGFAWP